MKYEKLSTPELALRLGVTQQFVRELCRKKVRKILSVKGHRIKIWSAKKSGSGSKHPYVIEVHFFEKEQ